MTDYTDLQKAAEYAAQDVTKFADEGEEMRALQKFHEEVDPETVLVLIAENQALKGPHDWLAEDLIKELVDNAQAIQENADDGEEDEFVIVLLAAAQRIRRQEASVDQLKTENKRLVPFEEAYATACNVRNRLIKDNELLDQLIVANKVISDSFRAERDQLKAELEKAQLIGRLAYNFDNYKAVLDERDQLKADNERLRADYAGLARFNPEWDRVAAAQDLVREHMAMVVQLKAEIAGLKTGYEAYERVNAELKAENEELRKGLAGMLDMHLIAGRAAMGKVEQS